jgi:hypothetical protein
MLLCKWEGLLRKRLMSAVQKSWTLMRPVSIFEILNEILILRPVLQSLLDRQVQCNRGGGIVDDA